MKYEARVERIYSATMPDNPVAKRDSFNMGDFRPNGLDNPGNEYRSAYVGKGLN